MLDNLQVMIALHTAVLRPFRLSRVHIPARLRNLLPALTWGGGWLGLGLALGALTDVIVRLVA